MTETNSLTVTAPDGAHFDFEEVATGKGADSLGLVPILIWDDLDKSRTHYGDEGLKDVLNGTSLRVSFQGIARRYRIAKKTDDEITQAEIDFKPGKRAGGASTPVSRASRAARQAAEKVNGDTVTALLEKIARGELSEEDLTAMIS